MKTLNLAATHTIVMSSVLSISHERALSGSTVISPGPEQTAAFD